jgi:hypothetical protein
LSRIWNPFIPPAVISRWLESVLSWVFIPPGFSPLLPQRDHCHASSRALGPSLRRSVSTVCASESQRAGRLA